MLRGRGVRLAVHDRDKYGRHAPEVYQAEPNANLKIVKVGQVTVYPCFCTERIYYLAERRAKNMSLGVAPKMKEERLWDISDPGTFFSPKQRVLRIFNRRHTMGRFNAFFSPTVIVVSSFFATTTYAAQETLSNVIGTCGTAYIGCSDSAGTGGNPNDLVE